LPQPREWRNIAQQGAKSAFVKQRCWTGPHDARYAFRRCRWGRH